MTALLIILFSLKIFSIIRTDCACSAVESTKHYLFERKKYNEIRILMLTKLANYCVPDLTNVLFCIPLHLIQTCEL